MHWLIRGFSLLRAPGVRSWVLVPLMVNVVFFVAMIVVGMWAFGGVIARLDQTLPPWLQWLATMLWPIFLLLLLGMSAWSFSTVTNVVASPFNGILAEQVQRHLTGETPPSPVGLDVPRVLWRQLQYLLYMAPRMLGAALFFVIPGLQVMAPAVWFAFNAWTSSVQYVDYASDNNGQSFGAMRVALRERRGEAWGFGALVAAAMMVPILNLFVMPAAVAGATAMWLDARSAEGMDGSREKPDAI